MFDVKSFLIASLKFNLIINISISILNYESLISNIFKNLETIFKSSLVR